MALHLNCDRCGESLNDPGALIFSPPVFNNCTKYHLCIKCWIALLDWMHNAYGDQNEDSEVGFK